MKKKKLFKKVDQVLYIYLDESGDLGFGKRASKYFIVACIIAGNEANMRLNKIMKKIRERKLKKKFKKKPELKFSNTSPRIRRSILNIVAKEDIKIYTIVVNKKEVPKNLHENRILLYSYLIKDLFEKFLKTLREKSLVIYFDRMLSQSQQEVLKTYILIQHKDLLLHVPKIEMQHNNSEKNKGLQIADFIVGAIAQKYEKQNLEYIKTIKKLIWGEIKLEM